MCILEKGHGAREKGHGAREKGHGVAAMLKVARGKANTCYFSAIFL